ncbi:recombinase family protein [Labrys monachus]|uniref:DNA invertase Pin-like site-specific DNA recombinase n=1 Tax=Labrys monachus TaxID=217067 RepID=A0ABU0F790_9HYPH|nr:recombinase family protein [Labrys monachus]MDQ0390440.1 DNA invertase Pin-like site-specific DNA recombinase [Labrys monachus]
MTRHLAPRVALYARYSSDNQSEASIEDQFRICREHARRERWEIVGSYEDAAISGASTVLRSGIQRLIRDAQRGEFKIVLAEALDRISRDQADVATLYKHLKFAGITIVTMAEGEISELHVGLKGTMNALFLKDLAMKTHRGLRGRVEKGKAGGGLCYGYKVVKRFDAAGEPIRGDREIIPQEADTIRRIFRDFASGKSPKAIAVDLNREGVPGPLGRAWGDTSIRGHVTRGTGIVNNELYAGVLVWNRQRFVKDPSTGKRVSRPNPESAWIRTEVPHLRIVDDALWSAARARQKQISALFGPNPANTLEGRMKRLHLANRPVSLLSGLLTCGCCGGKFGIITPNRYGCLNHHRRGTCDNNHTITRDKIEARVLAGLKEKLVSSEAVAAAVRAYAEEMNRLNHDRRAQAEVDRRALVKIDKAIAGIMAAIEDGLYQPSMKARMEDLERQKAEIGERLSQAPVDIPDVHPNIANAYRLRIDRFTEALDDPDGGRQAAEALRSLIGEIVLTPGEKRGEVHAELRGELFGILDFIKDEQNQSTTAFMPAVAACPRNQRFQQSPRPYETGRGLFALQSTQRTRRSSKRAVNRVLPAVPDAGDIASMSTAIGQEVSTSGMVDTPEAGRSDSRRRRPYAYDRAPPISVALRARPAARMCSTVAASNGAVLPGTLSPSDGGGLGNRRLRVASPCDRLSQGLDPHRPYDLCRQAASEGRRRHG